MSAKTNLFPLPHIEPSEKRIRALFAGQYVVDTTTSSLVWLKPNYPAYFFNDGDIPETYLEKVDESSDTRTYDIAVGNRRAKAAATKFLRGTLAGLMTVQFSAMDAWFEEDEEVFVHPKDPYKLSNIHQRVDVLQSSRHIRVEFNGQEVANTKRARRLFETSLRVRTYIPKADCRMDLLVPSELSTQCPYKGIAAYYHIRLPDGRLSEDSVWWYRTPLPECIDIKGLVAFYDEKLDVYVDGELQRR